MRCFTFTMKPSQRQHSTLDLITRQISSILGENMLHVGESGKIPPAKRLWFGICDVTMSQAFALFYRLLDVAKLGLLPQLHENVAKIPA